MATSAPAFRPIAQMGTRTKVIVMAGTMLGMFTAAMDQTIVGTSMPRIIADLGGFGLYSWVGTGFLLASTATVPVVGKLTDIYGRKPFYMAGIFILKLSGLFLPTHSNFARCEPGHREIVPETALHRGAPVHARVARNRCLCR